MVSHVGSGCGRAVSARRRARVVGVRSPWDGEGGIDFDLDERDDHDRGVDHDRRDDGDDEYLDRDDGWRGPRHEHSALALVIDDDGADPSSSNDDYDLNDARAFDAAGAGCPTGCRELR
jgi:hypothetical protein